MIEVQTDETCYRLVDDSGNESSVVDYGDPCIILSDDELYYCLMGDCDDTPKVFQIGDGNTPVEFRTVEVAGLDDDDEDNDDDDEGPDDDGGEEVGVQRIA